VIGTGRAPARRDQMTADWFDALASERLLVRACPEGHISRPDVLACDVCGGLDLTWVESNGRGVIVSRAVDHATNPPTSLVIVELAEGPWLFTRSEGADVAVGDVVTVRFVHALEGDSYPVVTAEV